MRSKDCSLCAKMRMVLIDHPTDQAFDCKPGSTPEKVTRSLFGCGVPARGSGAPQPRQPAG
jgi:hypothetical protein